MSKTNEVAAVLLDLGGVVLKIDWRHTITALGLHEDPELGLLVQTVGDWEVYDKFERGKLSTEQFHEALCGRIGRKMDLQTFTRAWNALVEGPIDGVDELLKEVASTNPLYALSNTNVAHMAHVVPTFPVLGHFRKIFTSCDLGMRKPEPEIYERIALELRLAPGSLLFVDDNSANVEAARKAGLRAELSVNSTPRLKEIFETHGVLK